MILVIIFGILQFDNSAEATVSVDSKAHRDSIGYNSGVFNISNNTGHSEEPQIMKSGNNIYLLWIDDSSGSRDVYFKKSSDNGCTFNRTINLGIGEGGSLDPKMAISGDNIYVTWEQTPGNNGAVFFAKSNDNGASFETARNLGNNTGFNGLPQIAASGNNVYVVWHDATKGILFARSSDYGSSFETVKNLGNNTGFNGFPQIVASGNNVYVEWTNNFQEKYGQIYFTRSTDNGASFNNPIILHELRDDGVGIKVFSPRIAVDLSNNNVYLVWHSGREVHHADVKALISDVYFTRSTDNGASFDETVNLSNYSGWSVDPQIAVSQDNNVYVVWTNNFQEKYGQIYFTRSTDNGASFDETVNLSNYSGWSVDPQIAVSQDNNVYVVWTNNATGNEEIVFNKQINDANNCINLNLENKPENLDAQKKINATQKAVNIAIVQATFTEAAYDKSFYMFYEMYKAEENKTNMSPNTTKYTDLLLSKLDQNPKTWSALIQIADHLKWLTPKSSVDILTDKDVHTGTLLFSNNGTNLYDIIMLEHQ
ncbi:MAG TPA: sialidase family protein, partial [Nitrososphaeraceae archaeon]